MKHAADYPWCWIAPSDEPSAGSSMARATLLMLLKEPATRIARVLSEKAKKGPAGKTVLEINDLVKALEEAWGVSAAAAVAVAGPAAGAAPAEEKTEFDVILKSAGANKIAVIKEIRAITGLGLKDAKYMVDGAPKKVKEAIAKDEADKIAEQLKKAGAEIEIK